MTIPASGAMSMGNVSTELGLGATTIRTLGEKRVRAIPGKHTGVIAASDLRGKTISQLSLTITSPGRWQTPDNYWDGYAIGNDQFPSNGSISVGSINGLQIDQLIANQNIATPANCHVQLTVRKNVSLKARVDRFVWMQYGGLKVYFNRHWNGQDLDGVYSSSKDTSALQPYVQATVTQAQYNTIVAAIRNKRSTVIIGYVA